MQLITMEYFKINNTNTDPFIKNNEDTNPARFGHLNAIVDVITALQNTPPGSGVASVQSGTDILVDNTDPLNPIVNVDLATLTTALSTALPYVNLKGTAFSGQGQVTGDIEVKTDAGGVITLRFGNGDIIALGVYYGDYSAISFYDATANETVYLYLSGGELIVDNPSSTYPSVKILEEIYGLKNNKVGFGTTNIDNNYAADKGRVTYDDAINYAYISRGTNDRAGWAKLPTYFAKYSAIISQTGTNAPIENFVIESDFLTGTSAAYSWTYVSVGHYNLTINGNNTFGTGWLIDELRTIVRYTNGSNTNVSISTEVVNPADGQVQISIKTTNPQTGSLANGLITQSIIEVEFYPV